MANASLKAVILAAGKGTRMKELTTAMPKPMLKVAGKPVLEHIVRALAGSGIKDICIITGYQSEVVEDFFGDGNGFGARICYRRQTVQDGTGKAPELASDFVGDSDFLLAYGDILVDPANYPLITRAYTQSKAAGLITVIKNQDVSKGAAVTFDDAFFMAGLVEKPAKSANLPPWYNAGIYIFGCMLFQYTRRLQKSPRGEYELPDALRAMISDGHKIKGFELQGYWIDVRDPDMLRTAEQLLRPE